MFDLYVNYAESVPAWYGVFSLFVGFFCGISAVYAFFDGGMFAENGYYRSKMVKGIVGVFLCIFLLYPVVCFIYLIRLPFRWNKSELDEVEAYERKKYAKRGLDYDEEMYKIRSAEWLRESEKRYEESRKQREAEEKAWLEYNEQMNARIREEESQAAFGEMYFGGR